MTFTNQLSRTEDVAPVFNLRCEFCGRSATPAATAAGAFMSAMNEGWFLKLQSVTRDGEYLDLNGLLDLLNCNDVLCPRCYQTEFKT